MADFDFNKLLNLGKTFGGIALQQQAGSMQAGAFSSQARQLDISGVGTQQGAFLTASGYKTSAESVLGASRFNIEIDRINSQRQLKALSRQYQRTLGSQIVGAAASGLSSSSKSFLLLRNEVADNYSRNALNLKQDLENNIRAQRFEAQVKATQLENQARATIYNGEVARISAANQANQARMQAQAVRSRSSANLFSSIPTALSQIVGLFD